VNDVPDDTPITAYGLTRRVLNAFERNGIKTVGDLRGVTDMQMRCWGGFGEKCVKEVREVIGGHRERMVKHVEFVVFPPCP